MLRLLLMFAHLCLPLSLLHKDNEEKGLLSSHILIQHKYFELYLVDKWSGFCPIFYIQFCEKLLYLGILGHTTYKKHVYHADCLRLSGIKARPKTHRARKAVNLPTTSLHSWSWLRARRLRGGLHPRLPSCGQQPASWEGERPAAARRGRPAATQRRAENGRKASVIAGRSLWSPSALSSLPGISESRPRLLLTAKYFTLETRRASWYRMHSHVSRWP